MTQLGSPNTNLHGVMTVQILQISVPFKHCIFRECNVTVAVGTSCTGICKETFLGLSSTVSVEFRVHEVNTATITQHSRNTQY